MRTRVWLVVGALVIACSPGADSWRHGVVKVEFVPTPGSDTVELEGDVSITMNYGTCLARWYEENPDMQQDGVEGAEVFASWAERLCDADEGATAQCSVSEIDQTLASGTPRITATYEIAGALHDRILLVGPFPTTETADCTDSEPALVRLGNVHGLADDGSPTWSVQAFAPASAIVDQGGAIRVEAGY